MSVSKEQQREYEDYLEMFATDGWKTLMKGTDQTIRDIMASSIHAAPTNDQWQFLRGQVSQLSALQGFENFMSVSHEQALLEPEEGTELPSDLEA